MTTEINNVEPARSSDKYIDLRPLSVRAQRVRELSEILDELFELKRKYKNGDKQ